jgi:hypothetical protein
LGTEVAGSWRDFQSVNTGAIGSGIDDDVVIGEGEVWRDKQIGPGRVRRSGGVPVLKFVSPVGFRVEMNGYLIGQKAFDVIDARWFRGINASCQGPGRGD